MRHFRFSDSVVRNIYQAAQPADGNAGYYIAPILNLRLDDGIDLQRNCENSVYDVARDDRSNCT